MRIYAEINFYTTEYLYTNRHGDYDVNSFEDENSDKSRIER